MFAGAAIGASHLVQSTRAGASYGFSLLLVVILANIFKYPFFEYGQRYTAATGESIIAGYRRIGVAAAAMFLLLNLLTSVISAAGVTIVTSAIIKFLLTDFLGIEAESISLTALAIIVAAVVALILYKGSYKLLDRIVKYLIIMLSIFTVISFITALFSPPPSSEIANSLSDSLIPFSGHIEFGFLIALVGWMPAPVEASSWSSLWALEKEKEEGKKISLKQTLFDFNVGYIATTILACLFLGLGALVLFSSGQNVSSGAVGFVRQLMLLYTSNLGSWALPIISLVALATMGSTTLTVIDAYPRAIEETIKVLKIPTILQRFFSYKFLIFLISASAVVVIWGFQDSMTDLIDFVTTVAFIAAPIFGTLNVWAMKLPNISEEYIPPLKTRIISYAGIGFALVLAIWYIT